MSTESSNKRFGLIANGSSRKWELAIDECLSDENQWVMEIEGPHVYITLQLKDIGIVPRIIRFLRQRANDQFTSSGQTMQSRITLGRFGRMAVTLVRDDEDFKRWFFIVGAKGQSSFRITLFEDDIKMLTEALCQAKSEMPDVERAEKLPSGPTGIVE